MLPIVVVARPEPGVLAVPVEDFLVGGSVLRRRETWAGGGWHSESMMLDAWGEISIVGPLGGGNRNTVLEIRRGRDRLAARVSLRPAASLDWELDLTGYLAGHGLRVPEVILSLDGRRHAAPGARADRRLAAAAGFRVDPGPADC
jgi:hypothetical protein